MTRLVFKAQKPYGHTAYTRRSKGGKLSQVKAKGVKPKKYLFHTTGYHNVEAIKKNGLLPRSGDGTYRHGSYGHYSQGKIFFGAHWEAGAEWAEKVQHILESQSDETRKQIPVTLRVVHRPSKKDKIGEEDVTGSRYTTEAIPPHEIEFWHPVHGWKPVDHWGEDTGVEHGIESCDEHGEYVHTSGEGGYTPTSKKEAHAHSEHTARYHEEREEDERRQQEAREAESLKVRQKLKEEADSKAEALLAAQSEWSGDKRTAKIKELLEKKVKSPIPGLAVNGLSQGVKVKGHHLKWADILQVNVKGEDTRKSLVFKAKEPYGHVAYTRRSKSGKLSQVKAKGVKDQDSQQLELDFLNLFNDDTREVQSVDSVIDKLTDSNACLDSWARSTLTLKAFNDSIMSWYEGIPQKGKIARKKLLADIERITQEHLNQIPEARVVKVGGLEVETLDTAIEQHAAQVIDDRIKYFRRMLTEKDRGKYLWTAQEIRDTWYSLNTQAVGAKTFYRYGNTVFQRMEAEPIEDHNRRLNEKERTEWEADWRKAVAIQLRDVQKLPESHHALMEKAGTRVRFLAHPAVDSPWNMKNGTAGVDARLGVPLVEVYSTTSITDKSEEDFERHVTLTHEVGHIVDQLVTRASYDATPEFDGAPRSLTDKFTPIVDTPEIRAREVESGQQGWGSRPVEWFAEAYRWSYRDGSKMTTQLQERDLDALAVRDLVDNEVATALKTLKPSKAPAKEVGRVSLTKGLVLQTLNKSHENFVLTAMTDTGKVKPVGEGKFGARKVSFTNGITACLKPINHSTKNFHGIPRNTQHLREVAASQLDRQLLHFDIVPPAVLTVYQGAPASISMWVRGKYAKELVPGVFNRNLENWGKRVALFAARVNVDRIRKMVLFDLIINNTDRHAKNCLFMPVTQNMWAIDHGLAFGKRFKYYYNVFHKNLFRHSLDLREDERARLAAITKDQITKVLDRYLSTREIWETYLRIQWVLEQESLGFLAVSKGNEGRTEFPQYREWFLERMEPLEGKIVAQIEGMGALAPA